jgi:hypothetical protein
VTYGTESEVMVTVVGAIKNLGLSDEEFEAWKRGEFVVVYGGGRKWSS